jgi:hypothetical protein
MAIAKFLHRQAERCFRLSQSCYDLTAAERLRHIAEELRLKAEEIEDGEAVAAHMNGRAAAPSPERRN